MSVRFGNITYIYGPESMVRRELTRRTDGGSDQTPNVYLKTIQKPEAESNSQRETVGVVLDGEDFTRFIAETVGVKATVEELRHFQLGLTRSANETGMSIQMSGGLKALEVFTKVKDHTSTVSHQVVQYARDRMDSLLTSRLLETASPDHQSSFELVSYHAGSDRFESSVL